jgi:aryl-alcohol dehydrogenase-like predicted oxidoreductase
MERVTMQNQPLGGSGMHVSRLCLGTMTFGNPIHEPQCVRLVHHALDHGVNFFDTSNVYEGYDRRLGSPGGVGEELLGTALSGRRHDAVICTKLANPVGAGVFDAGLSSRHLDRELEKSLKRLRTDWIDVVLAHRWDPACAIPEVWGVFDRWVRSGKVRVVGVSNWPVWRLAQAAEFAARHQLPAVTVSSPKYNLMCRGIELEHVPCALHYGAALVTYQAFQSGLLTGKYRYAEPPPPGSRAAANAAWLALPDADTFERLEGLGRLAREAGMSMAQYAISWILARRGVASVIVGCRSPEQLDDAAVAVSRRIPPEHFARIDSLFPPPRPTFGEQVLRWTGAGWRLEDGEMFS